MKFQLMLLLLLNSAAGSLSATADDRLKIQADDKDGCLHPHGYLEYPPSIDGGSCGVQQLHPSRAGRSPTARAQTPSSPRDVQAAEVEGRPTWERDPSVIDRWRLWP